VNRPNYLQNKRKGISRKLYLFIVAVLFSYSSQAAIFVISGIYQGKNVFIQNPALNDDGVTFCTNDVYVNDVKVMSNITTGAYEIDLSAIRISSQLTIKITHKDGCKPRVLNPQVIRPSSMFHYNSFQVDKEHFIWSTRGEKPRGKYVLEYYANDKWNLLKEMPNKGSIILNNYDTDGVMLGLHKYRLKLVEAEGRVHYSQIVEFAK
jgi:hypothetical protein